jgi:prolyl-tRNA synthetase
MRASQWFISTLKENPNDAELVSHRLMLRAGLIRKLGSGLYTWMPLGLRVLQKVETIIREEMNYAGAMEVFMPAVQPAELWQETGRWETFGNQLLTMKDSQQREYCFGPTHEEVITDLMRKELKSYKQLPLNFYQIQTKFRDEIRPRFGVMRAREFLMKDAYSFHINENCLANTYEKMYQAYERIFSRMGLKFRAVQADTGAIGGAVSHEFQVLADSGEDLIYYSDTSTYAANVELASAKLPPIETEVAPGPCSEIHTPKKKTIEDVSKFLACEPSRLLKMIVVSGNEHPAVALVLKGDDVLNEVKAAKHPWIQSPIRLISEEELINQHQLFPGYLGPINSSLPMIIDSFAWQLAWFHCGANREDHHLQNASWDRNQTPELFDLRTVKDGDLSPDGQGHLKSCRGIEVGHVFQLGKKYSESMKLAVLDEQGKAATLYMGCYGLGVSRIVAAIIEQCHDDKGIIWPQAVAPFDIVMIPIGSKQNPELAEVAESLYHQLQTQGFNVLFDDRSERPGVLFADHDLIGIPHRLVIGEKAFIQGKLEYKHRNDSEAQLLAISDLLEFFKTTRD